MFISSVRPFCKSAVMNSYGLFTFSDAFLRVFAAFSRETERGASQRKDSKNDCKRVNDFQKYIAGNFIKSV